jgi:putative hydrolase of the HAD superfamily
MGVARMLRAVLFDLDGTLYDRDELVRVVAAAQFDGFREYLAGVDKNAFVERVFALDAHGYKDRAALYSEVIAEFGLETALASELEHDFSTRYLASCNATPDTIVTLRLLKAHGLKVGVITNGAAKIQTDKLLALGLSDYFDAVLISEVEGVRKPDAAIFSRALERCQVRAHEAAFVGDNPEADVFGAMAAGLQPIWKRVSYWEMSDPSVPTIDSLAEILPICLGSVGLSDGSAR